MQKKCPQPRSKCQYVTIEGYDFISSCLHEPEGDEDLVLRRSMMKTENPRRLVAVGSWTVGQDYLFRGLTLAGPGFFDRICWDRISIGAAGSS